MNTPHAPVTKLHRCAAVFLIVIVGFVGIVASETTTPTLEEEQGGNVCEGKKPLHSNAAQDDEYFANVECMARLRTLLERAVDSSSHLKSNRFQ